MHYVLYIDGLCDSGGVWWEGKGFVFRVWVRYGLI
jgi:hypothetical protein